MRAIDFLLETLSHFAKGVEGPPPGVPFHADAEFETDLVSLCRHQRLSAFISDSFDKLALPPTISRITIARIKHDSDVFRDQRRRRVNLAGSITEAFSAAGVRAALLGDVSPICAEETVCDMHPVARIDLMIDEHRWMEAVGLLREMGFIRSRIQPRLAHHEDFRMAGNPGRAGGKTRNIQETSPKAAAEALRYHQYFAPLTMHNRAGDSVGLRFRVIDFGHPGRDNPAWKRTRDVNINGEKALAIGLDDHLIYSVVSFGAGGFIDLLHVLDAGILVTRRGGAPDWGYITRRLRGKGLYPVFCSTLEHICDLLNIQLVSGCLEKPAAWRRRLFHMWWKPGEADYTGETEPTAGRLTYGLVECGGLASKVLWLRRALFPKSAWVRSVYGRQANMWLRLKFLHDVRSGRRRRAADSSVMNNDIAGIDRLP